MNLALADVFLLLAVGAAVTWFLTGLRVRELALQAARRACSKEGVQLLDETVSGRRVSLSRDAHGHWRVWRQFYFEYSLDGRHRRPGHVIMLGGRLQALVMTEPE